jgi:hypothetical protein
MLKDWGLRAKDLLDRPRRTAKIAVRRTLEGSIALYIYTD